MSQYWIYTHNHIVYLDHLFSVQELKFHWLIAVFFPFTQNLMEQPFCAVYAEIKHPDFTMACTHVKAARYVNIPIFPHQFFFIDIYFFRGKIDRLFNDKIVSVCEVRYLLF